MGAAAYRSGSAAGGGVVSRRLRAGARVSSVPSRGGAPEGCEGKGEDSGPLILRRCPRAKHLVVFYPWWMSSSVLCQIRLITNRAVQQKMHLLFHFPFSI